MTDELSRLQEQRHQLRSLIMATKHTPKKRELQSKRDKLSKQIQHLQLEKFPQKEKHANIEINKLLREKTYVIDINGFRVRPNEDLEITLKFQPCGHKHTMHIKEILRYRKHGSKSEQTLLSRWKSMLGATGTLETRYYCEQCKKDKERKLKLLRRRDDSPIGTAWLTLQIV